MSERGNRRKRARNRSGVTRRQVLAGTGAGVAGASLGAVFLESPAAADREWDYEADIVVVGSGAGACTAALTAHHNGDSVVMIEKAAYPGGTSSKSAGVFWIPNNFTLQAKGIDDKKEDCLRYMARFSYPRRFNPDHARLGLQDDEYALLEAFYDNASPTIEALRGKGDLRVAEWRMFALDRPATDYLDQAPENKVPTGRPLGPLKADGSMGGGVDLMEQLIQAVRQRGIELLLNHRGVRLVMNDGRAIGLEAESDGAVVSLRARKAVIFASGGYAHNTELVNMHQRHRMYGSCAMPAATGDFIGIAAAVGASMGSMGGAWRTQIVLEEALVSRELAAGVFFPPGDSVLQVNKYGVRVVNETCNYNDRTEVHGIYDPGRAEFPNNLLFMVYDQRTAEAFAGAYPLPANPDDELVTLKGDTLDALADNIAKRLAQIASQTGGVELAPAFTDNLKASIERFNRFAANGVDEDFQRGTADYDREWHLVFSPMRSDTRWPAHKGPNHTIHPLRDEGPYYAIILASGALDTTGGPAIDARARVLDADKSPIAGLYGAGNCIASPSGEAYWGAGHTLGLTMTFGYIAANQAHKEVRDDA